MPGLSERGCWMSSAPVEWSPSSNWTSQDFKQSASSEAADSEFSLSLSLTHSLSDPLWRLSQIQLWTILAESSIRLLDTRNEIIVRLARIIDPHPAGNTNELPLYQDK